MNIIKSDLVSSESDVLWEDIPVAMHAAVVKPVLILVNAYTPESSEGPQILKMLDACKLNPEQYNILQINKNQRIAWHKLREQVDPQIIFLIGVLPSQLGISSLFRMNVPNHFNDRIWLATLSISELEQHPDVKKQLWAEGMKPVFIDGPLPGPLQGRG